MTGGKNNDEQIDATRRGVLGAMLAAPIAATPGGAAMAARTVQAATGATAVLSSHGIKLEQLLNAISKSYDWSEEVWSLSQLSDGAADLLSGRGFAEPDSLRDGLWNLMSSALKEHEGSWDDLEGISIPYPDDSSSLRICDIFTKENKVASYLLSSGDERLENFNDSALSESWMNAKKLLDQLGVSEHSEMTLEELRKLAIDRTLESVAPRLQAAFRENPESFTRMIGQYFGRFDSSSYMPHFEKVFGNLPALPNAKGEKAVPDFKEMMKKFDRSKGRSGNIRQEDLPPYQIHPLPADSSGNERYIILCDFPEESINVYLFLKQSHPEFDREIRKSGSMLCVEPGTHSSRILKGLLHPPLPPAETPDRHIRYTAPMGTALQCSVTARNVRMT